MIYAEYLLKITPSPLSQGRDYAIARWGNLGAFNCFKNDIFLTLWRFVVVFFEWFLFGFIIFKFCFRRIGIYIRDFVIIFLFVSLFRFSCNIYRRNNTTISRDMREKGEREREREDTDLNSGSPINSGATFFFRGCCRTNAKRRCNGGNNEHKRWNQQKSGSREISISSYYCLVFFLVIYIQK